MRGRVAGRAAACQPAGDGLGRYAGDWQSRLPALAAPTAPDGELVHFNGMPDSLLRSARREGLLRAQHNRQHQPVLKKIRNHVAHGGGHHLVTPVESARTTSDVGRA